MANRYVDIPAIVQVIGNIYTNPSLLDNENYCFYAEDFTDSFHKILFGSIYNLYLMGSKTITLNLIEDYLQNRPESLAVFKSNKGEEYLLKISKEIQPDAFKYYYDRMKKMTLLRMYHETCGMDLKWLYDIDNIFDTKKRQIQEEWIDNSTLEEIANEIDKKIDSIKIKYVNNMEEEAVQAGSDILDLLSRLKETPEFGYPLYGRYMNTITRGARLKKLYMRSAPTGVGKTRFMIGDIANIACNEIYDTAQEKWVLNGTKEPAIFITTEQEVEEIQTLLLAFLSGVDEEVILTGKYTKNEWDRVLHAAKVLKDSPLYIKELPDFSMQDIEGTIKKGIRDNNVKYIAFDYIHSSMKILSEISSKARVANLREDNILFMIGVKLKDIANQYGVFILTATQLNGDYKDAKVYDQNLLRGAKSLADKIDCGMMIIPVSEDDLTALEPILQQGGFPKPDVKISIYKNRRGKYKDVLLWCQSNRGTCRNNPLFLTSYQYEMINIEDIKITVQEKGINYE